MALNLNKNEGEKQTPSNEKKGLNLSKSSDTSKKGLNLSKSDVSIKDGLKQNKSDDSLNKGLSKGLTVESTETISTESRKKGEPKKKSKIILIVIIALVLIGVFWYMNIQNNGSSESPALTETPAAPTDTLATQSGVPSDTGSNEQPAGTGIPEKEISINGEQKITNVATQNTDSGVTNNLNSGSEGSITKKAQDVIDGVYGNGTDRKRALGIEYKTVQAKVNEMYRNNN